MIAPKRSLMRLEGAAFVLVTKGLAVALVFVLVSAVGAAQAEHGDYGQSISSESPFQSPTCSPPVQRDERYDMEHAPHLAVNPTDPDNIAVAWVQDDANGIVVGVSHDGGITWTKSIPPETSACFGGDYLSAFNPHLSFGPEGRLYLSTWNHDLSALTRTRITVHTSTNGGDTWSLPVPVVETTIADSDSTDHFSWVVADPTSPGTVYASWNIFHKADPDLGLDMGFARSTDGGLTWSVPQTISPAPEGFDRWQPQLVVLPDGSVVNFFIQSPDFPLTDSERGDGWGMATRSTDGGNTWSDLVTIAARQVGQDVEPRVYKLDTHHPVNTPAVSSDGTIYYAWSSIDECSEMGCQHDRSSRLFLAFSSDGGVTWATPSVIRESEAPMAAVNIAVAPNGRLGVLFYDLRNDDARTEAAEADVWFMSAPRSARSPKAWTERHVAGPFDILSVPSGVTTGPNQGIAGTRGGFVSAYTLGRDLSTAGPMDIFFSRLHP